MVIRIYTRQDKDDKAFLAYEGLEEDDEHAVRIMRGCMDRGVFSCALFEDGEKYPQLVFRR